MSAEEFEHCQVMRRVEFAFMQRLGLVQGELFRKSRKEVRVQPRYVFYNICLELNVRPNYLERYSGFDHSTILYARKYHRNTMALQDEKSLAYQALYHSYAAELSVAIKPLPIVAELEMDKNIKAVISWRPSAAVASLGLGSLPGGSPEKVGKRKNPAPHFRNWIHDRALRGEP